MAARVSSFRISHSYTTSWQLRERTAVSQGSTAVTSREVRGVCAKGGSFFSNNVAFQARSLRLQTSCRIPSGRCSSANGFPQQVPRYSASASGYKDQGTLCEVVIPLLSGEGLYTGQLLSKEAAVVLSSGADPESTLEVFEGCEFKVPFHQAFHDASCPMQFDSQESNGWEGTMLGAAASNHLADERAALETAFYAPDSLQSHSLNLPPSTTRNFHMEESQPSGTLQQVQNMFLGTAKILGALVLAAALALGSPHPAMAARSMGRAGGGGFSSSRSSSSRGSSSRSRSSHGSSSRSSSGHGSSSHSSLGHGSSSHSSSSHRSSSHSSSGHGSSSHSSSGLGLSSRSSSSGSSRRSSSSIGGRSYHSIYSSSPSSSTSSSSPSVSSWSSESTSTWASPSARYHRSPYSRRLTNAVIEGLFGDGSPRAQSQATRQKQEQGTEQPRPDTATGKTNDVHKTTEADETSEWVYWLVGLLVFVSIVCILMGLLKEEKGQKSRGKEMGLSFWDELKEPVTVNGVQTYVSDADMRNMITIVKIQVALLGQAKSVQLQMDKLCKAADTTSKEGLHNLLTETLLIMLRHTAYWAYGNAQATAMGYDAAERKFQHIALEERSKAEQETLVNKAGTLTKLPSVRNPDDEPLPNEYIVVTVLAAIKGGLEMPESVHGASARENVTGAIKALSQAKTDNIEVLEVLWVPQEDDDTLTHAELIENFTDLSAM